MYIKTLTVTALNNYIKKIIDSDFILNNIVVKGEISNFKRHSSGHLYFSLKDDFSKINCVMFSSNVAGLNFLPENGEQVEIKGRISVYLKDGSYQLYCESIKKQGIGDLYVAFLELKGRLEKEGLFSESHKKTLPAYPKRIGVISSSTGAAVRDIINVTKRRNKKMDMLIYPSLVQGEGASKNIIEGIEYLNSLNNIDVIIIARGGGSIEELWAFNDENLARAIYASRKPIVTGVGHETDFTIADFVSDRRAPTPSAAAEVVVPRFEDMKSELERYLVRLTEYAKNDLNIKRKELEMIQKTIRDNNPLNYVVNQYRSIEDLNMKINHIIDLKIDKEKERIRNMNSLLNAHNPLNVLNRGYSIIQDSEGNVVSSVEIINSLDEFSILLKDGKVIGKIKK